MRGQSCRDLEAGDLRHDERDGYPAHAADSGVQSMTEVIDGAQQIICSRCKSLVPV